jgi:3-aminobutyryl-CoA ammonia-lyase
MNDKRCITLNEKVTLRVRVSEQDVHYAGGIVNGAWLLSVFGDVATEICVRYDGDEGLLRAYSNIDLLAPIRAGDFIEVEGRLTEVGNTSRKMELLAKKVISLKSNEGQPSAAFMLDEPIVVGTATLVCVVTKEHQRYA